MMDGGQQQLQRLKGVGMAALTTTPPRTSLVALKKA